jgi:iron complex outermembrane receptor protein
LKDASATAIYGSRASNGVIIVTTKKGKKGAAPRISYNGDFTISTIAKKYETLNATEYKNLISSIDGLDVTKLGTADTNWQDEIFRTALSTKHTLSVSGGIGNIPYRVSAAYDSAQGIVKTSWMHRANASLNLAPSFLDDHLNFNVTAKFMYERDRYADAGGAIGSALSIDPTRPVYTNDETSKYFGGYYQPAVSATYADPEWKYTSNTNAPQNPVALLEQKEIKARSSDFTGNFEADYKIHGFEDLHIHASYGGEYTESKQTDVISPYSYSNNYFGWNGQTRYYKYSITTNAYAQYQKEVDIHFFDVMVGAEESHYHRHGFNEGQGTDPYTGEAHNPSIRSEQEWATHNTLVSYFSRLNYTLLDRYMLTATFRADGSSKFSKDNHWGYFPSIALAWKINEEKFMKDISWWNEFKLRLGWGKTGQQEDIGDYNYFASYNANVSNVDGRYPLIGINDDGLLYRPDAYNQDLKWETTTTWNAGLDFSFFNNRISGSVDYYYRKTTDLINDASVSAGSNFRNMVRSNIGSLKNNGIEVSLTVRPIQTTDWQWEVTTNFTYNKNEITELTGESSIVMTGGISSGTGNQCQAHSVGHPARSFYVYQQVYDESGLPLEGVYVDRNADGVINDSDRYFYKSPAAPYIAGLSSRLQYKNWDFGFGLRANFDNYVFWDKEAGYSNVSKRYDSSFNYLQNVIPGAVQRNWSTYDHALSDYFVHNASFLKCDNITLGYSFDGLFNGGNYNGLSGRIYASATNVFTITKYKGIDPEVESGIDNNMYPRPFTVQVGLNLNF